MSKISIVIPARNEQFLQPTIKDLLSKAEGDIEIIVILDGYWPDPPLETDERLVCIHRGRPKGMRNGINSAVAIASGDYIMKIDAHCMVDQGYDVKLSANMEDNWVSIPSRFKLDPINWCIPDEKRPPVDYQYIESPTIGTTGDLAGKVWSNKNKDPEIKKIKIDDLMAFQGSCWFMKKTYFYELELMDEKNYGTFRKEPQEIGFKCWLTGGRVIRNKNTWYAHLHKGKKFGRGYSASKSDFRKGDNFNKNWLDKKLHPKQIYDFKWLIDKFNPPGWENYKW